MTTEQLHEKYGEQQVQVFHAEELSSLPPSASHSFYSAAQWEIPLERTWGALRYLAETDPSMKQLVGYTLLRQAGTHMVYVTERIAGDERLVGMCSLGTGGHVEPGEPVHHAVLRELCEEVGIAEEDLRFYLTRGYIYDDSSEVNSVHFGVVPEVQVAMSCNVEVREKEKLRGQWMTVNEIRDLRRAGRLESWSEIVFDALLAEECI